MSVLQAPFAWFDGQHGVVDEVWARFGQVINYVDPFFGPGAVLLGRPTPWSGVETVNEADELIANFWRAVKHAPDEVEKWADDPDVRDSFVRRAWLADRVDDLRLRLNDPGFYDVKAAGWWLWDTRWQWDTDCHQRAPRRRGDGVLEWLRSLSERMANVQVVSGDWRGVCGPESTFGRGLTGVFITSFYYQGRHRKDRRHATPDILEWALANGDNPNMRIALCGHAGYGDGEDEIPESWSVLAWGRARIWFSPHCLSAQQGCRP